MLDLIILVLISLVFAANFLADIKLDSYFLDLDIIYFEFLKEEQEKLEIKINIKNMIKIEQKLKTYKKIINNKDSSSYKIWLAEGSRIKLKKQWQEKYNHNKKLIAEINKLK